MPDLLLALVALAAIIASLLHLHASRSGIAVAYADVGGTPVTIYRPADGRRAPVVVVAHGFAGSQQLMTSFATTFAHAGYIAVTFDFRGHGRNPQPLTGSIARADGATRTLVGQTRQVAGWARRLGDGRLAVLGHSMASDIVVRVAQGDPAVIATIAVSMFSPAVTRTTPRNLLVIVGGWEAMLQREALRAVGLAAPHPHAGVTYGDFAAGTARRASFSPGVEHVSVLYSRASMAAALSWLDAAFGVKRAGAPWLDDRGPWIMLLLAGLVALGRPLATLLPVVSAGPAGAGLAWRRIWPGLLVPALATPLVLRVLPTHFLPILVGDYLAAHFALYGLLTGLCLRRTRQTAAGPVSYGALAVAALAVTGYGAIGLGHAIDSNVTSFAAVPARIPLILAMLVGTLSFFLTDEWLTRGAGAARGAYAASKLAFLLSLAIAVALDFERLFFLVIIIPVIVVVFVIYGLFSTWSYARTRHPAVAGIASAIAFAWAIGVTFPMLAA